MLSSFLDSCWSSCGGIISFLKIMECYHMECSLPPVRPVCYINPITEIYFRSSLSIGFEVMYENPSHYICWILTAHLLSWRYYQKFVFPYITLSIECVSKFLNAQRKHREQRKPSDLNSSLNDRCCKLWFESFGNCFYDAFVLKHKQKKCI